jgi:hypothetical protein
MLDRSRGQYYNYGTGQIENQHEMTQREALLGMMSEQARHQPTNLRQSDEQSRFYGPNIMRRGEGGGGFEVVGQRVPGARLQTSVLQNSPESIAAANRLRLLAANRGG